MSAPDPKPEAMKPWASWHVIYNLDGTFRGYEWALDKDGNPRPSQVYVQEHRDERGRPKPAPPSPLNKEHTP